MTKSQELRQNAENCSELARVAEDDPKKKSMAQGWNQLAQTQAWLDGEPDGPGSKAT
jgi:hypothetical protein